MSIRLACLVMAACIGMSCTAPPPLPAAPPPDDRVKALADSYLEGYFDRNPDAVTYYGVAGKRHDRLVDNSLSALKTWEATYGLVREGLEGPIGARICRNEL